MFQITKIELARSWWADSSFKLVRPFGLWSFLCEGTLSHLSMWCHFFAESISVFLASKEVSAWGLRSFQTSTGSLACQFLRPSKKGREYHELAEENITMMIQVLTRKVCLASRLGGLLDSYLVLSRIIIGQAVQLLLQMYWSRSRSRSRREN